MTTSPNSTEAGAGAANPLALAPASKSKQSVLESRRGFPSDTDAVNAPVSPALSNIPASSPSSRPTSLPRKIIKILTWTPPRCRWDPNSPPRFSLSLNLLFAVAGSFTVANLYYNHPILNILARDFGVKYEQVAQIPTVMQAGYAAGLLLLCPLGDLLPRRPFVVGLVGVTALFWLILCITTSLPVFTAISFIVAITTVTPQLMLPLVGDLAPPHRRGAALSIVTSGLGLGIVIARTLSGIITNFTSWRIVYWLAFALQCSIFILLWAFMPDYPSTNPTGLSYFRLLLTIFQMLPKHPILVQACITAFFTATTFTSFWTTLTFLLAGPPYNFPPLHVGLFGLIGIVAMLFVPLYARKVTDRFVPHLSVLVGLTCCLVGICLGTYIGTFHLAGPVFQALLLDFGMQTAQVANRSSIYSVEPKRRNGVNTAFMVAVFCGQLVGTAVGNAVFARKGWVGSGSVNVGFIVAAIGTMCMRGPWEKGWVGWNGGWSFRKRAEVGTVDGRAEEGKAGELGAIRRMEEEMAAELGRGEGERLGVPDGDAEEEKEEGKDVSPSEGISRRGSSEKSTRSSIRDVIQRVTEKEHNR